jgi:hypothetical protein
MSSKKKKRLDKYIVGPSTQKGTRNHHLVVLVDQLTTTPIRYRFIGEKTQEGCERRSVQEAGRASMVVKSAEIKSDTWSE